MPTRVLQFGTSRFLQAHADLFIHEARESGQDVGPITVVKTTPGTDRAGRLPALADPAGFPVRIRGLDGGAVIDRSVQVRSVVCALDARRDWRRIRERFAHETELVISNTGDTGFELLQSDRVRNEDAAAPPASYPAKLLSLLRYRYDQTAAPLVVLPCELVSRNGQVLRQVLTQLAFDWNEPADFLDWLTRSVVICDTLVDRIVSEPLEPAGAVAEPYAFWAVRWEKGRSPPFQHPCVVYADDITPYSRLKLHILNLGHSWLAEIWRRDQRRADETVREILGRPSVRHDLTSLYRDEIIPGFEALGMGVEASRYVDQTMERFDNPFLDHRLSDIAGNHFLKILKRGGDFLDIVYDADQAIAMPRLEKLVFLAAQMDR